MADPQLLNLIRSQLSSGISKDDIRKTLSAASWTPADVDAAFAIVESSPAALAEAPLPAPAVASAQPAPEPTAPEAGQPVTPAAPVAPAAAVPLAAPVPAVSAAPAMRQAAPAPYQNTSGQGAASVVPEEIKRWNWGAFGFNWIWGVANGTYIALLCLIPFVNLVMIFVLGAKGSEWAWRNERWESIEHFKRVQRRWAIAWIVFFVGILVFYAAMFALMFGLTGTLDSAKARSRDALRVTNLKELQLDLELYLASNGKYPSSLDQLSPQYAIHVPADPLTEAPYEYQLSGSDGSAYTVCAAMEESDPGELLPPASDKEASFSNGRLCFGSSAR